MKTIRPVFLSSYPPEQCGLATFTKDSADAVDRAAGRPISSVIAIEKTHSLTGAGGRVAHVIENDQLGAYRRAASVVNNGLGNVVNLEHEFGLYPGAWGGEIMEFVRHCEVPIVSTLLVAETRRRAYRYAESMFWPRVGRRYLDLYSQVARNQPPVRQTESPATTSTVRQASSKQLAGKQ